ncbi:MAG TPA: hypothetical protein VFE50_11465 [Cyclobacteriaceae bacterium]|nr:hypothetical protein [Cyclobacteriaceae bacterium]
MTSPSRLGLDQTDLSGPVESDEELINEVCASYRLYTRAMFHMTLQRLREHFKKEDLQASDLVETFFPLRGRRKAWHEFQVDFALLVPGLRTPALVIVLAACWFLAVMYLLIWGALRFPLLDVIIMASMSKGATGYLLYMTAIIPPGIIIYVFNLRLPAVTFGDLIDRIVSKNTALMLGNDRAGLKALLREHLDMKEVESKWQ